MTQQGQDGVGEDQLGGVEDRPLDLPPFAVRRPSAKRQLNPLLIGGALFVLAAATVTIVVTAAPKSAVMDALNGATPNLSDAESCLQNQNFACAEADYRAYLRKYPKDASTTGVLAILLTQDGQHRDAINYYKRALALGISAYDLHANYAVSLNNTGQVDEAINQNYAALKLAPSLVDVRGALADQLVKKGRGEEAISLLEGFDQGQVEQGQAPYFPTQIAQIRSKLGLPSDTQIATNSDSPTAAHAKSEIALEARNGALYVPAVVDESMTLKFVVDSGASDVCIPADVAQTLMRMGKLTSADERGSGMAELADGSRVPAEQVMIHSIQVGGHEVKNVLASVTNTRGSLLLGQSFLRRFKSWSVDNNRKILLLRE